MGKNTMKSSRVAVLMVILLGFVEILEIEGVQIVLPCPIICAIECAHSAPFPYPLCFNDCITLCHMSTSASNCARSCGLNKSITIDIGIYYLIIFIFFNKLNMFLFMVQNLEFRISKCF